MIFSCDQPLLKQYYLFYSCLFCIVSEGWYNKPHHDLVRSYKEGKDRRWETREEEESLKKSLVVTESTKGAMGIEGR